MTRERRLAERRTLGSISVREATVYPTMRHHSHPGKLLMGVFDRRDRYVDGTILDRPQGEVGAPLPPDLRREVELANGSSRESGEVLFAGELYNHFGHFLVESCARLWAAAASPDLPIVWSGASTWNDPTLRPWQREVLDVLSLKNPTRILTRPTRWDRVHIPDIGYRYPDRFHPQHASFLARYQGPPQEAGNRVWLSRSRTNSSFRDLNAEVVERRLAGAGWSIVHPQECTIREQLDIIGRAEVIAGEEGSAFHSVVLLKDVSAKKFHIFRRRGVEHQNMHTIGVARDMTQVFHDVDDEVVLEATGRAVVKMSGSASSHLNALRVPVPDTDLPAAPPELAAAIDELAASVGAVSYLELGDPTGALATSLSIRSRTSVSPEFDFDPRQVDAAVRCREMGVAEFATFNEPGGSERYDLIRVDGRLDADVDAATLVAFAHERTVWVVEADLVDRIHSAAVPIVPRFDTRELLAGRPLVVLTPADAQQPPPGASEDVLVREQEFHDREFSDGVGRSAAASFYAVDVGKRRYMDAILAASPNKDVLVFGCGPSFPSWALAERGASVVGIDLSPVAIERAAERVVGLDLDVRYLVMDAHALQFPDGSFDLVCGSGILHHLDARSALREVARVLRPQGTAIFYEPLGTNPLINLYRRLTPGMRTPDEHPLVEADFAAAAEFFRAVEREEHTFLALFGSVLNRFGPLQRFIPLLHRTDRWLFRRVQVTKRLAWTVVLRLRDPQGM